MKQTTTIGLDLAKNVFQVHGVDAAGKVTLRRQLLRAELIEFWPVRFRKGWVARRR